MKADLHVHTTMSDGSDTFEEVLVQARERGVARIAFTNHDTTRGLDGAAALGARYGVQVTGGPRPARGCPRARCPLRSAARAP